MGSTSIEWTDHSVNPIRARFGGRVGHTCVKVSPGCKNCYASRLQPRFGLPVFNEHHKLDVEPFLDTKVLERVLRRKKPTKLFWCDMTDMFGDWVPNEWILACLGVMAATPQHTHQVLTKRAARLPAVFELISDRAAAAKVPEGAIVLHEASVTLGRPSHEPAEFFVMGNSVAWPLPNVWLGVSVEDQQRADERIPVLLRCPAAVRFLSVEPLLGPVNLRRIVLPTSTDGDGLVLDALTGNKTGLSESHGPRVDWAIIGSESGPKARPMEVAWARSVGEQCVDARVPMFTKQIATAEGREAGDRKGGDPRWWPTGDWPREFPR